jgi:drug/metabolite transporter (DMT)-like permease
MEEKMTTTKLIGLIIGLVGVIFSFVHLGFMIFTDLSRRYHYFVELVLIGFVLSLAGLLLLGGNKNPNNPTNR